MGHLGTGINNSKINAEMSKNINYNGDTNIYTGFSENIQNGPVPTFFSSNTMLDLKSGWFVTHSDSVLINFGV